MELNEMMRFDREHIWHPYTSMIDPLPVYPVRSADGVYIELETGERLIDGMSSWWSVVHGYNNPVLNEAAKSQIDRMSHVMFGGLTHEPAVRLAERLVAMTPDGLDRVFYCDSGSVSVEVAIKMALQYMQAKGEASRTKLATVSGGYHGDTWHAMSVCDPDVGMHTLYDGRLPVQFFADRPGIPFGGEWDENDIASLRGVLEAHHREIAALIIEPIVQGASGMWIYHPEYLRRARELCDEYGILMIADEVATGFGRTGRMFACEWAGITPDIMCLGKAITGGYMSFAAVMATGDVALTISSHEPHSFMHGPTFMGNPLACAVANASLELISQPHVLPRITEIDQRLHEHLECLRGMSKVADLRILGAIAVVELTEPVDMSRMQKRCVEEGVWIRPFGKLFYVMPQYVITDEQLGTLCRAMVRILSEQ